MRKVISLGAAVLALCAAHRAVAQTVVSRSLPTQLFHPAIGAKDTFLTVEGASVARHLGFGVGLMFNYQHKPLVIYRQSSSGGGTGNFSLDGASEVPLVRNQATADIYGALGLQFGWLKAQLGLDLPVNVVLRGQAVDDRGQATGDSLGGEGIGDLRVQLKAMLLDNWKGMSIALSPIITVPTACLSSTGGLGDDCDAGGNFGGDPNFSFRPRAVIDYRYKRLYAALNVGGIVRAQSQVYSTSVGSRLIYGIAGGYQVHRRVFAMAEMFGQAGFATRSDCALDPRTNQTTCSGTSNNDLDSFPLELDIGAHISLPKGFQLTGSVGFGLIRALGSPQFRALTGLRWAPDFRDSDGDGVYDGEDACPTQKEDRDNFLDQDGCPEADNDRDRIPDARDKCPNEAEDFDQFEDDDGCPEADNDGDGIPDIKDHCPLRPETKNGFSDDDGCPDIPDDDGDGVANAQDKCPRALEDRDGFQDEDGCPDVDNDGDGVPDNFDSCKNQPEDMDKFQDDDGCPDIDNDSDGVPDSQDKCPKKKETINGVRDDDGCPDRGRTSVFVKPDKIALRGRIRFSRGGATLGRRSRKLLDQVALTLLATPRIKWLRIGAHTSTGNQKRDKQLSKKRAEAVRDLLVQKGVAASRLVAVGYGSNKSKSSRIELTILKQKP